MSAADACAAVGLAVGVSGAWLVAAAGPGPGYLMWVSDEVGERLAELEQTLGEGPSVDALVSGGPVLASDLRAAEVAGRWPVFARSAVQAGAGAVFAFPLRIGAIRAGVLGLYRARAGVLTAFQLGDALVFADTVTLLLLEAQDGVAGDGGGRAGPGGVPAGVALHRAEIDQAAGMLTEQLGTGIAEALLRLRAYAFAHERRLSEVARDIVARRLRLTADRDPAGIAGRAARRARQVSPGFPCGVCCLLLRG